MFSALKKFTLKQEVDKSPPGIAGSPMSGSLQKKFSRGVNYNMKIIIKGDRNVGKSCLFKRLQGGGFVESYTPTEEIQVASIQWSFKTTEDIVKVEVWDVVDKGKARPRNSGLKLSIVAGLPEAPALDAEFLDVYKGTHGVILMMDVTKSWTFDYVTREIPKIPPEIPILLLGNHCDMAHHRVVSIGQAQNLVETICEKRPSEVIYSESSMRNGFGLRLLHKFLGLPFLRLQKEAYVALMDQNKRDIEICEMELSEFLQSDDADYNSFLNKLSDKRRQIAESNSRICNFGNNTSVTSTEKCIQSELELRPTKSIIVGGGQPIVIGQKLNENTSRANQASTVMSNLLQNVELIKEQQPVNAKTQNMMLKSNNITSVEEFCPDEGALDRSFLDDLPIGNNDIHESGQNDSDSDNDNNPMVARFNDEPELKNNAQSKNQLQSTSKVDLPINQQILKVNPLLNKNSSEFSDTTSIFRKNSQSSEDLPTISESYMDNDEPMDCWIPDTSVRRSPEGVEDTSSIANITQSLEITSRDEKNTEKKSSHKKKKIKDKEKYDRKEKKKKKKGNENALEEFLNGTRENDYRIEESYEAI